MSRLLLLSLFVTAGYVQLVGGPRVPGALGQIDAEVRVGMSQAEAVAVIRAHDLHGAEAFFTGETHDGKQVAGFSRATLDDLPAGDQMAGFDVSIDDRGRHLEVTFGLGGAVTAVELTSCRWFGETWWLACQGKRTQSSGFFSSTCSR
ncbi:hypothetical protein GobsT_03860 [Gemmata obscuriglobus]|uniref:hypothetical protein n=1 Tax=Gemmata obscuriglobus TaxID=114 RepID=UPI0011CD1716|nr:hypothetical protein [Gemmata obscuriglobus]QEG25659.1 hypothetical protein GobsT_03860 [Gemmata obscuriglobus]VTR99247.1 unnamed protein product [Gemmata obscuriglobus UQM 2246]